MRSVVLKTKAALAMVLAEKSAALTQTPVIAAAKMRHVVKEIVAGKRKSAVLMGQKEMRNIVAAKTKYVVTDYAVTKEEIVSK